MAKKQKKSQPTKSKPKHITFLKQHSKIVFVLLVFLLAALFAGNRYSSNRDKFSDNDYAALSSEVERIFKKVGGEDIAKNNYCDYSTSGKYDLTEELYCTIEVAAYLTYTSDQQALLTAKTLERDRSAR